MNTKRINDTNLTVGGVLDSGLIKKDGVLKREGRILLSGLLGVDQSELFAHPDRVLSNKEYAQFVFEVERLSNGEPLAYVLGRKEFYGREFRVDERVLIPRPETEEIINITIEHLKALLDPKNMKDQYSVLEIGVGSGAVIVTLVKELIGAFGLNIVADQFKFVGTDLSEDALVVAIENAKEHSVDRLIDFRPGSFFEPVQGRRFDLIVSNPPYLPAQEAETNRYEPQIALAGGANGDELVNKMLQEIGGYLNPEGVLVYEGYGGEVLVKYISEDGVLNDNIN